MIDTFQNTVYMGTGDVMANFSVTGTREEPRGIIAFQNSPQTGYIGILPDDYEAVVDPDKTSLFPKGPSITLSFSSPESIDAVISVLKYVKKITFEDIEMRDKILALPLDEMMKRQMEEEFA